MSAPRREKLRHNSRMEEANCGRSSSWRGFVEEREAVAEVGSSSRWPHTLHLHLVSASASASAGTCPCFSASSGCSRWDAQSMKGAFERAGTWTQVGPPCTCNHTQNRRHHLRENSHACCGGAIKPLHDSHSHSNFNCLVNNNRRGRPRSKQKQQRAAEGSLRPPFPSALAAPYVLCQHCALLLHALPTGTLRPSRSPPLLTLKCGSCLNFSTFSTHHHCAAPSAATAAISPPPSLSVKEFCESSPMPGYGASHGGMQEPLSAEALICGIPESALQSNGAKSHKGSAENDMARQDSKKVSHPNGSRNHGLTERREPPTVTDIVEVSLELTRHTEAGACLDSDYGRILQGKESKTGDSFNGICAHALGDRIAEGRDCSNQESIRSQDRDIGDSLNDIYELTLDHRHTKAREGGTEAIKELREDSHPDGEQEITILSSVQSWVDSLSPETGYESDASLLCSEKCAVGCEKHARSLRRSPLHQHFGYKSPLELFEKVVCSEDEEMRARTETNSTASTSSSPNNACQRTDVRSTCTQLHTPSLRGWSGGAGNSPNSEERDTQRSLSVLLKRGLKKGNHSPVSLKGKVVVNGRVLSSVAIKQAEQRAGKLRPGSYWYDCKAGFWGVEGGPCLGILPPLIEELCYQMAGNCSNGDTQVYVNGRELHSRDLAVLSGRGLSEQAGRAYALGFDGVLVDETTGLEVKHLGKLAPTVERKGKGFGMFAGDGHEVKKPVVLGKSANSSQ